METVAFLFQLVLVLVAARIFGEIAAYLKVPVVIGELVAGIAIGPSLLGWVDGSETIHLLAQIGIIMLLFEVGLETDIKLLAAAGGNATIVAFVGVLAPLVGGYLVSYYFFDFSILVSLFIGCTLTATSIGITLRVLKDIGKQKTGEAQIIIGAAVLDDILGIILLSVLYDFSVSGKIDLWHTSKVTAMILLFLAISPFIAKLFADLLRGWSHKTTIPGLLPVVMTSIILLFGGIAHVVGAPELLGGFAVGLALSKFSQSLFSRIGGRIFNLDLASSTAKFRFKPDMQQEETFCHRVEEEMRPIIQLFTPIFFVSVGLALNLRLVDWSSPFVWELTSILVVVAVVGKLISGFFLIHKPWIKQLIIGIAMIPRGEVGLVFANIGKNTDVFSDTLYASIILMIIITTLFPPLSLRPIYNPKFGS